MCLSVYAIPHTISNQIKCPSIHADADADADAHLRMWMRISQQPFLENFNWYFYA